MVDGNLLQHGLQQSMMSVEEVQMAVREHGVKDISEADLVVLEVDGNITVLSKNYSFKTVKKRKKPQLGHNPQMAGSIDKCTIYRRDDFINF